MYWELFYFTGENEKKNDRRKRGNVEYIVLRQGVVIQRVS
ncbi:hypothetical protein Bateq7PJ16_0217 [Bacillus subtilis]|nr:hypothetical protein Bateq7PJ16_0217 [Bacillus subtilis]RPJ98569.1 hypothetical protein EH11_04118 [Bacillus subtilis]RUS04125.1 hypothetical protein EFW59_04121 [Bacillus subtilis]